MMRTPTVREQLGCWLHERWRVECILRAPPLARLCGVGQWLDLRNRNEYLKYVATTGGRRCLWEDSSQLTVARVFPRVSTRVLNHCLSRWPVFFNFANEQTTSTDPVVSFLVPIGGSDRLRQLQFAIASLRSQTGVAFEIIVIEQSHSREVNGELPDDVRYFHVYSPPTLDQFNKSRLLNCAARYARGQYLVIHDADMVVPICYAQKCADVLKAVDSFRPMRLLFNLTQTATSHIYSHPDDITSVEIESIVANTPNPIAVRRDIYWDIGGHDESFVGWGGEDLEFLSRLRTRQHCDGGLLPIVHLWHPHSPKKQSGHRNNDFTQVRLAEAVSLRIERLRNMQLGTAIPPNSH